MGQDRVRDARDSRAENYSASLGRRVYGVVDSGTFDAFCKAAKAKGFVNPEGRTQIGDAFAAAIFEFAFGKDPSNHPKKVQAPEKSRSADLVHAAGAKS